MSRSSKNSKKKGIIIALAIVLVIAIPICVGILAANHYLNKMNFEEEETLQVNPEYIEEVTVPEADEDISENIDDQRMWYNDNIINILLIGCDLGSQARYYPRADSIIVLSINTLNSTIKMVSLSRATYVSIPGHGNARLNAAHAYGGPKLLVETIEENYKIRIDKYISIDFEGFIQAIDTLGGVDIYITQEEVNVISGTMSANGISPRGAGTYHLNGNVALEYARIRGIDNDRARTGRQRIVLTAILEKFKKMVSTESYSTIIVKCFDYLNEVLPLVSTNFKKSEIIGQAPKYIGYLKFPVTEAIIPKVSVPLKNINGTEVLILDWPTVKNDIHEILYPGIEPQEQS